MSDTFESNLKKLEDLVGELEKGELSLDESIEKFEKGIELSKKCNKKLEDAEKKINILVAKENGELEEKAFVEEE